MAKVLDVPVAHLFESVRPLRCVKFCSNGDLGDHDQILAETSRWFYRFSELEHMLNDQLPLKLAGVPPGDPRKAARSARETLGLDESEPIDNICGLLESAGIKMRGIAAPADGFFGLSVADTEEGDAIVVNTWSNISVEGWIFTAAYELGHLVLHRSEYGPKQTKKNEEHGKEASSFARHFLLPDVALEKEWKPSGDLSFLEQVLRIKKKFKVSYRTVLSSLHEKYPNRNVWGRFHFEYKCDRGEALPRNTEPDPLPEEDFRVKDRDGMYSDRLQELVYKAVEQEHITVSRAAAILGIPLRKMHSLLVAKANSK